jgi:hypothetical protein
MARVKFSYEERFLSPDSSADERWNIVQAKRKAAGKWVQWTNGIYTHNPDGTYTQELIDWLKANEARIELSGYAVVGEPVNIWNPQETSWDCGPNGKFIFSKAYREYLLSEGFLEELIRCCEVEMDCQMGGLSYSFPDRWMQERIQVAEIPNPSRYEPLQGMISEGRIALLQRQAVEMERAEQWEVEKALQRQTLRKQQMEAMKGK